MAAETELNEKQLKALSSIRSSTDGYVIYPGIQQDLISSKVGAFLHRAGMIKSFIPHNPAHKERWVITMSGRAVLARAALSKAGG